MRKGIVLLICLMLVSSAALASPLTDFSAGKGAVDLTMRDTKNTMSNTLLSIDFDKKYNLDAAVTLGLGNNWALQYRYFQPESAFTYFGSPVTVNLKLDMNEFNALYKLDKNIAVFAGYVSAKASNEYKGVGTISSRTKNLWQVGLVGSAPIGDKTTLWGSVAAGADLTNWEIGVGYAFTPNFEFNVSYRDVKANDLDGMDVKARGLGFGVTLKW